MTTVRVLEDEFIERINAEEASFSEDTARLNKDQLESVRLCCELFRTDVVESLKEVSVSQQYRLLQAQKLLRQIYSDLERPTIFLLCMLPWPITNLTKLDQRKFLPKLRTWCENIPEKKGLQKIAKAVCEKYDIAKSIQDELNIPNPPPRKRKRISHVLHNNYTYESGGQSVDPISGIHDERSCAKETQQEERHSSDAQLNDQTHKNDKTQMILTVDDIPGFQISLLADQLPQSVINLDIMHLIRFLQKYQSTSSNPEQFRSILGLLQGYQSSCRTLHYIQLIIPWYGATPSIDIKIDSKIG
ncbi:hypothetical protein ACJ72_07208 [Emergomyces africanus]|uniref:Uncharacterized protein n=1 Tax=Emergomyces africanus TaxID=1955775 RepID=A0A1B7NNT7_9EURO|nr:hypothetical protein ACJ72_07208 [Emergomyces africanus]